MKGKGCDKCNGTGYKGRVGLYEVMEITDELRELILVGASALELRRKAIEEGMITLRGSGLRKIKDGVTTLEEVVRETVSNASGTGSDGTGTTYGHAARTAEDDGRDWRARTSTCRSTRRRRCASTASCAGSSCRS